MRERPFWIIPCVMLFLTLHGVSRAKTRAVGDEDVRLEHSRGEPVVGFVRRMYVTTVGTLCAPFSFDRHDWLIAGASASIPLAMIATGADDGLFSLISNARTPGRTAFAEQADKLGQVPVGVGILATFGAYGYIAGDERGIRTLESGALALGLAGAATNIIKFSTGRARPNSGLDSRNFKPFGGHQSFPSGHTTVVFAIASTINEYYPRWVGTTAFLAASSTAYARVYKQTHWPSDVIAAAALSTAIGHIVARLDEAAAHGDIRLVPMWIQGPGIGITRGF